MTFTIGSYSQNQAVRASNDVCTQTGGQIIGSKTEKHYFSNGELTFFKVEIVCPEFNIEELQTEPGISVSVTDSTQEEM